MKLSDYDKYVPESFKITIDIRHANMDQVDQIINIFSYFYNLLKEEFGISISIKVSNLTDYKISYVISNIRDNGYDRNAIRLILYDSPYTDVEKVTIDGKDYKVGMGGTAPWIAKSDKPHYSCCNKGIVIRCDSDKIYITFGACCGNRVNVIDFMTSINKSAFIYRATRDFVYCDKSIGYNPNVTQGVNKLFFDITEVDRSVTTDCWDNLKPTRELFSC